MIAELTWSTGGYPHTYRPSVAGRFGCDPCWHCQRRPAAASMIWMNSYGDLYCDPCAIQLATQGPASAEGMRQHTDTEQEITRLISHLDSDHGVIYSAERDLVRVQTVHADEHAHLLSDPDRSTAYQASGGIHDPGDGGWSALL